MAQITVFVLPRDVTVSCFWDSQEMWEVQAWNHALPEVKGNTAT